jgi:lipoprotein-anchoring transpeptidase ErfK/SrfK
VATSARPRYGRIAVVATAFVVTVVTVGAGVGLVPSDTSGTAEAATRQSGSRDDALTLSSVGPLGSGSRDTGRRVPATDAGPEQPPVPADSGDGRRIVFDQSDQRVWLVGAQDRVRRTYLVSGSLLDNLDPGTYAVYSKSRWAVGIEDSGTMQYMVRFARGDNAPIGFHSIPTKDGTPLQTTAQLGTPQSHGCVRQDLADALALWRFAPLDTKVVVTA